MFKQSVEFIKSQKARVRLYCQTLPDIGSATWSDMSFEYVKAFVDAEIPIRIISTTTVDLTNQNDRWYTVRELFQTPLPDKFRMNLVCGPPCDLDRYYTDSLPNLAITAPWPRKPTEQEVEVMQKYDRILVPTWNLLNRFGDKIINKCKLYHVRPDAKALKELVKEYAKS